MGNNEATRHRAATLLTAGGSFALILHGCSLIGARTERMQEHYVAGGHLDELKPSAQEVSKALSLDITASMSHPRSVVR